MGEEWIVIPKSLFDLLVELLRRRAGLEEDELLQETLLEIQYERIDNIRKAPGRETSIINKDIEEAG